MTTDAAAGNCNGRSLTLNAGSSSIKFALFSAPDARRLWSGAIERIGPDARLSVKGAASSATFTATPIAAPDHASAIKCVLACARDAVGSDRLVAIGHRIVHGGPDFCAARRLNAATIAALHQLVPLDPDHMPPELALVAAAGRHFPGTPQFACFDTAFHHDLPRVAQLIAIPQRSQTGMLRRYGFHGLSYEYLMRELHRLAGPQAGDGRIVLAHLGSGSSLSAVHRGRPMETSMGFTPASGVMMATRSGDIDPGLAAYLAHSEAMTPAQFHHMVNFESGLLGVSQSSGDMQVLLDRSPDDTKAADAVDLYCHLVKQRIGAFAATLGGLDTLVFSGGIGENAPAIRAQICDGLGFLGITLDTGRNMAGAPVISTSGAVTVRVIATDEEAMIAHHVAGLIAPTPPAG